MRPSSLSALVLAGGAMVAACGLSTFGDAPAALDAGAPAGDAHGPDAPAGPSEASVDAPTAGDARSPGADATRDAPSQTDAPLPPDAPADAPAGDGWTCTPVDAGILGTLDLSKCTLAGNAAWDENNDSKLTLTNSNNFEAGAGWYPTQMPALSAYDLTWSFRVGPGDTAGDGVAFAVLATNKPPDGKFVGNNGSGLGLQGLSGTGYAVAIDMYDTNDIRLVAMPGYTMIASKTNGDMLNDGNVHTVDVSWRAPSTITATLHSTSGDLTLTSSDPGLAVPGAAWFGFTGATGGGSDSHQEIAGITVKDACE